MVDIGNRMVTTCRLPCGPGRFPAKHNLLVPQLVEIASAYRRGARLSKAYSSISISHGEEGHPGGAVLERAAQLKPTFSFSATISG
jgi:hypothetical protein